MRITLTSRNELNVLIKAVKQMAETGEVSFEFGSDGLVLSYEETYEKALDIQLKTGEKATLSQLEETEAWNEAYTAGRIDSLMTALDLGLIVITDAAVLLDMDEDTVQHIYDIWHDDPVKS